jgi:hypothetical protein
VLPSVPLAGTADDNLRGGALLVTDIDGDGWLDIFVGTTQSLRSSSGAAVRSTRLLRGSEGFAFTDASGFLAPVTVDTGEADDILVGDIAHGCPTIVLVSETVPATSPDGESFRVFDWK